MRKGIFRTRRLVGAALFMAALLPLQADAHGDLSVVAEFLLRILLSTSLNQPVVAPVPAVCGVAAVEAPRMLVIPTPPQPGSAPAAAPTVWDHEMAEFKGQDMYSTTPESTAFRTRSFTRSLYTMLGGSATDASQLATQDGFQDPATAVSAGLATAMSDHYRFHDAGPLHVLAPGEAPPTGLVLEVKTTYWELKSVSINPIHLATGLNHYGVYYHAEFHLKDSQNGAVYARGDCDVSPPRQDAPTYQEAMADGGARIKQMLQSAAVECIADIETDYLGF